MINNLRKKISTRQEELSQVLYKALISVSLGIIGFIGTFFALRIKVDQFNLDFVWSLIFPMLVTQAWGVKYGLLSSVVGLSAFHSFYLWQNEGWACFVGFLSTIVWFVLHGYGVEKRKQSKRFIYNIYFIEIFCSLINLIIYFFLFPLSIKYNIHSWYNDVITMVNLGDLNIFFMKRIAQGFFILTGCDMLLLSPSLKKLFLFNIESKSRHNGTILARALTICIIFCFLSIFIEYLLHLRDNPFELSQIVDARDVIHFIMLIMFCMVTGSVTVRYLEKKQEAEELALKSERKQTEIQEEYKTIFDKMLNGMIVSEFIYDENGGLVDAIAIKANQAIEKHLGLKVSDVIGSTYIKSLGGNKSTLDKFHNILKTDIPLEYEAFTLRFNRYLLINAFKLNNKQVGIMFHDISELKQLEAKQREMAERLEAVFESTDDNIYSIDRNYHILNFNSALKDYIKRSYNLEIENGHSMLKFLPDKTAKEWESFYDNAMSRGKYSFEYYISHEKRYVEVFFNPINHNGEVCGTAVFTRDITKRKKAEQELIKINKELEYLVEERTRELRSTLTELEAFTYTVSHDLKSPLRTIDGYSRIILEDYGETLEKEAVNMITNIANVSCDMIKLIDTVLQYSTTSKENIQKEKVDIREMFINVFNEIKATCVDRNIEFNIEMVMPTVTADKTLIRQVVYNILNNSVKYTKNKDSAIINVGCLQNHNEQIFYIEDNGAGFHMKYAKKLFTMFQRLHNREEYEGSGIGLATVHKIIQKHGGRTWIESKLNKGTKIYFTLPAE